MPFSHHSHSGQFCPSHARDMLSEMVETAVNKKMLVMALTEHIPRGEQDYYPNELEDGLSVQVQKDLYEAFVIEARRIRQDQEERRVRGAPHCKILIGMEGEWIRLKESTAIVQDLMLRHNLDFMIGSVHHVHTIPIDFDKAHYERARDISGGTDVALYECYFDAQFDMLQTFKPLLVGHFDLIRLFSDAPDDDLRHKGDDSRIWTRICRNLKAVKEYGGVLEVNSSALRKGLKQPYPRQEICEEWLNMGGTLVMSDDSHATQQIGVCYHGVKEFLGRLGLKQLGYLDIARGEKGQNTVCRTIDWKDVENLPFWDQTSTQAAT